MTTKVKIELESLHEDVVIDVELWTSPQVPNAQMILRGQHPLQPAGRRKEDYTFTRLLRTLDFPKAGLEEYVYQGQTIVVRERTKPKELK